MDSGKIRYDLYKYRKQWFKEHLLLLILIAAAWLALFIATYFFDFLGTWKAIVGGVLVLIGVCLYGYISNKASAYAEDQVFGKTEE